jgi:hypothetical protein
MLEPESDLFKNLTQNRPNDCDIETGGNFFHQAACAKSQKETSQ